MNGLLCVAAIAASLVAPNLAINCYKNRCTPRAHTLCKYPNPNPAPACGTGWSIGFTEDEKTQILFHHNYIRKNVASGMEPRGNPGPQPAAFFMDMMSWDDELAEIAQRWANQCNFGNDECRDVDRFAVGQNVAMRNTSGNQHTGPVYVVQMWYNEVKNLNRELVDKLTTVNRVGGYTQIVWARTVKVGCGKIVYREGGWSRYYMVCNYGPAGNLLGEAMYDAVPD